MALVKKTDYPLVGVGFDGVLRVSDLLGHKNSWFSHFGGSQLAFWLYVSGGPLFSALEASQILKPMVGSCTRWRIRGFELER
jgi:hypothetical protein